MTQRKLFRTVALTPRSQCSGSPSASLLVLYIFVFFAATAISSQAQTFTTLTSFDRANGAQPNQSLLQGLDGNLYGTTPQGGANSAGTVFKITPAGTLITLYSFCAQANCADGKSPAAPLMLASNGNFYGTTIAGGTNSSGTVFEITNAGKLTTLYNFCSQANCSDGFFPEAGLLQATDGNLYGTTNGGGANGYGTIFEITPSGKLTAVYNVCNQNNCGEFPEAGLVQTSNGNFYGLTPLGGENGWGTVFEVTPNGTLTILYSFEDHFDGGNPRTGLMQAANGLLYGSDLIGGATHNAYCETGCGTIFQVTPGGQVSTVYSFCSKSNCADGIGPFGGLIQATDGNFYGTTTAGGTYPAICEGGCGTAFELTPAGQLTTLYNFCSQSHCFDGSGPYPALVQSTNGTFYGTTYFGGTGNACSGGCGTVFSLSVGLGPFIETVPTSAKVGAKVIILGNNLTGTTSVTFNGTAASFTVVSSTEITATVPAGATTGEVKVITPSGSLKSNVPFRVMD
jgi:uncharacterized repeat protein (TIGR03803 family)